MRYPIWYTEVYSDLLVRTLWYTVPSRVYWLVHSYHSRDILGTFQVPPWALSGTLGDHLVRAQRCNGLCEKATCSAWYETWFLMAPQVRNSGATLRIPSVPFEGICTDTFGAVRRIPSTPSVKRSVPRYTSRITVPLSVST